MKLLVIVSALLALRYTSFGREERRYVWLLNYTQKFSSWLQQQGIKNGTALLLLLMLPPLSALYLLKSLIVYRGTPLIEFIVELVLFGYALQPLFTHPFTAETVGSSNVFGATFDTSAITPDHIFTDESHMQHRDAAKQLLIAVNQNTFAVIFWFCLGGGYGAVLYRFINLLYRRSKDMAVPIEFYPPATLLQQCLDWMPARLTAIAYALAGNFALASHSFRKYAIGSLTTNDILLAETGLSAAEISPDDIAQATPPTPAQVTPLIERSLLLWLVLIAIFVVGTAI